MEPLTLDYRDLALSPADLKKIYRFMKMGREIEFRILALQKQGRMVGGVFTGTGNEATCVGASYALDIKRDTLLPLHRDMGSYFVKGQGPRDILCQFLGRANGPTRGRDANVHQGDPALKLYGTISHVGAMVPVAVGTAWADKLKKTRGVSMTFVGDGATNIGDWHEAMNLAAVMKVPLVVVIANNQYAYSTPRHASYRCERLIDRARGYGIPGFHVDGTDVLAVYKVCREAVDRARQGDGPTLIESETMRMMGHAAHDDFFYVPRELLEKWEKRDPLGRFSATLAGIPEIGPSFLATCDAEISRELDEAIQFAENSPLPDPTTLLDGVYAEATSCLS